MLYFILRCNLFYTIGTCLQTVETRFPHVQTIVPKAVSSVTRFGEILLLGQTFKNLLQTFEGLFSVWQNFEPTLATFDQFWGNLSC